MKNPRPLLFTLPLLLAACDPRKGVDVDVHNATGRPMTNVTVAVIGSSRSLGSLAPGETRRVRVAPSGESTVAVGFDDGATHCGPQHCCYVENYAYRGSIAAEIHDACNVTFDDTSRPLW